MRGSAALLTIRSRLRSRLTWLNEIVGYDLHSDELATGWGAGAVPWP